MLPSRDLSARSPHSPRCCSILTFLAALSFAGVCYGDALFWYDFGYSPGKLSMPPSGNGRIADWHARWPGHPDMYLTPSSCSVPGQGLLIQCTSGGCGGGFTCRLDVVDPQGDKSNGPPPRSNCVGNPCDAGTGNKYHFEEDFRIAESIPQFVRSYNSAVTADVGLGPGWVAGPQKRLVVANSSTILVMRGNGRGEPFAKDLSGQWVGDADTSIVLTQGGTGYTLSFESGASETYNTNGRLLSEANAAGETTTYSYDGAGRLSAITGPYGHVLTLGYDTHGRLTSMTAPGGGVYEYAYDSSNRLIEVEYPDGTAKLYHYEDASYPNHLTGISYQANGLATRYSTYAYDATGRAILTEHAGGFEHFTLTYDTATQTTVTDASNNQQVLTFAQNLGVKNLVSKANQADGKSLTQTFDGNNNLTCRKDEEGRVTTFVYNASNQLLEKTEGLSGTCASPITTAVTRTTEYEHLSPTSDLLTKVIEASVYASGEKTTELTYGDASYPNLPTAITISGYTPSGSPLSRTITLAYTDGQLTSIDGPRTDVLDVTTITYNSCTTGGGCGQIASIENALGHITTFDTYSARGQVTQTTDPNGLVTKHVYDARGRVLSVEEIPPTGPSRTTTFTYNAAGNVLSVTQPNGTVLTHTYNAAQLLTRIEDNLGNYVEYDYDLRGNRTGESTYDPNDVLVRLIESSYDIRNRIESIDAAGSITQLVYDAVGNLSSSEDPNGHGTTHDYDLLNRLIETVDALNGLTALAYDVNDHVTAVEVPNGATTTYVYDDLGNLLQMTSPDTGTTTYTFDDAGNRITQTDANGATVEYSYDALNRLTSIEYPNSTLDVTFEYDQGTGQKGRLTTMADGSGVTTFGYDAFGNLTSESKLIDGHTHVTVYWYDEADQLESITYPSGRTVDYTRNVLSEIEQVDSTYNGSSITVAHSIEYLPFGPLTALTFGNGLALSRTFDQQYRLTAQATGTVQHFELTLDPAGNVEALADQVNAALSQEFTYDALDRIDVEEGADGTKAYTYDANGNRLTRVHTDGSVTTQTLTYDTDSNRLATHDGLTVTLDPAGNTTADPAEGVSFVYDNHNRMVEAYVGAVLQASYVYNGQGQRTKKIEATGAQRTIVYHYGLAGELLGETIYDSGGAKIGERDYVWLDTLPLAQSERVFSGGIVTSDQLVYLHVDQLGTPRLATNDAGTVVWRWDSDAFGVGDADEDPDSDTNLVTVRLRFPGQYFDAETGLHYNYFRDYDPGTGRYMQSDPIGLVGGLNTYLYATANPLRYIDPFGLDVEVIVSYRQWYGHVDVRIDNRVYGNGRYDVPGRELSSFGLRGTNVLRVTDASRHRQSLEACGCEATGYTLDVSPEQEAQIRRFFENQIAAASPVPTRPNNFILPDNYSFATNNCATNAVDALQSGLPWYLDPLLSGVLSPDALEIRLRTIARPLVNGRTQYSTPAGPKP